MTIRIAINGFGRIGRCVARLVYESNLRERFEIVAINARSDVSGYAHLLQYDSVHGRFAETVIATSDSIKIAEDEIPFYSESDPAHLPWADLDVDIVFETTGAFRTRDTASAHLQAGAKKVLISAPAGKDVPTIVYGVNHQSLKSTDDVVSNASCTTNCLAPLVQPLNEKFGIENGLMTTIHAVTGDQMLVDSSHKDLRRARSAMTSMIPTKTGAAAAVGLVLPELNGKLDGYAVRVPTVNVSMVDLTFQAVEPVSVASINETLKEASETNLRNVLAYSNLPLVSIDFNHSCASSIFDATQTRVLNNLVKVVAWYDNEWGFSNRMLDTANVMMSV